MAGMQFLLGVKTKEFVLLCADKSEFLSGAISLKDNATKTYRLGDQTAMAAFGEGGDPVQFCEYIEKNLKLYKMRNNYELSPNAAAHFARRELALSLRSRDSYVVMLLVGGWTPEDGGYLASIDYIGNQFEADYLSHGLGGRFTTSILDQLYRADMTQDQAVTAIKACLADVKKRCAIALPAFELTLINKDGISDLPEIRP